MASSASRQDKSNPSLLLATHVGGMVFGITHCFPEEGIVFSNHMINPLRLGWPGKVTRYWLPSFLFFWPATPKKKRTRPISFHLDLAVGQ